MSFILPDQYQERPDAATVARVHAATLTIDAHLDVRDGFNGPGNDAGGETEGQFDLPKLERGGLKAVFVALAADPVPNDVEGQRIARQQVEAKYEALTRFVAAHPARLEFARSVADIERIAAAGKHAVVLSFLNAVSLGADLGALHTFHERGVRLLGLSHIGNNAFTDSSRPKAAFGDVPNANGGLTALGRDAIRELNRLGVIIDVTQLSPSALGQVLSLSEAPVIASHSAVRGRVDSPRNLTNAELRAIAATGGVAHIVAFAPYVRQNDGSNAAFVKELLEPFGLTADADPRQVLSPQDYDRQRAAYRKFSGRRHTFASLVDYLDAVDYAVRLIGIDHVGLSSDFNNGGGVEGFAHVGDAPNVTAELLRRGYGERDIAKLWGGNLLRVFRAVEARAGR